MQLSFAGNIRDLKRDLSDAALKQLPFATSLALNKTGADIQKNETKRLDRVFDRPTPFTKRAWAIRRSSKRNLVTTIYCKRIQARYLLKQEEGGTRRPAGRALVIPNRIRLNKYGNMTKGSVRRLLAKPNTFSGRPKGNPGGPGIYSRMRGGKLRKQVSYTKSASYAPRLNFTANARKIAQARMPTHLRRELEKAFANRRR